MLPIALQRTIGNRAVQRLAHREADEVVAGEWVRSVLRSPGTPLDALFRSRAESVLGADLSQVRVHTDATAADSARAVGADAYTSGTHIVFGHGKYNTVSTDGQHRLAHELTHVAQQQRGAVAGTTTAGGLSISDPTDHFERAADAAADSFARSRGPVAPQRILAPAVVGAIAPVQRKVGFEFEVGRDKVTQARNDLTREQLSGVSMLLDGDVDDSRLRKGQVLARGRGFELQIDQGREDYHLEFVTAGTGFPENRQGRTQLRAALKGMQNLGREIAENRHERLVQWSDRGFEARVARTDEISGGVGARPQILIRNLGEMEAEPQTTAGIRLDRIVTLIENMVKMPGETVDEKNSLDIARTRSYLSGKANRADKPAMSEAPGKVRDAINRFKEKKELGGAALPTAFGSESLVGLMSLIYTYLIKGQERVEDYPKSKFPLLGITNFAAMFTMLPAVDSKPFTDTPNDFVEINLDAAGLLGTAHTAVFSGGFGVQLTNLDLAATQAVSDTLRTITRYRWLSGITQGIDRLSAAVTSNAELLSMGKLHVGETVGQHNLFRGNTTTTAPILELRRMVGRLPIDRWAGVGLDVFDALVRLNDLKGSRMRLKRTERWT